MAEQGELSRVVIADTGPLVALSRIGQLTLLRDLFGHIEITEQICSEALERGQFPGQGQISAAIQSGWLRIHPVDIAAWHAFLPGVDEEASLSWALPQSLA